MKLETPCVPWYLPVNDTSGTELCTPWEIMEFQQEMDATPGDYCDHCLPDCTTTIYKASVTAAPFRHCDYKNLGTSYLCDFDGTVSPKIWGQDVQDQYANEMSSVPFYVSNDAESSYRKYAGTNKHLLLLIVLKYNKILNLILGEGTPIFTAANERAPTYNAYEKDIAMVTFFFDTGTVVEYVNDERVSVYQFISQIGGTMGLCIGFSLISGIEILYWLIFKFVKNII